MFKTNIISLTLISLQNLDPGWEKGAQYVIESGLNWLAAWIVLFLGGNVYMTCLETTVRSGQSVCTGIDGTLMVRSTLYWLLEVLINPEWYVRRSVKRYPVQVGT